MNGDLRRSRTPLHLQTLIKRIQFIDNTYYTYYNYKRERQRPFEIIIKRRLGNSAVKGSHHKITKNGKIEIIPVHGKDMKTGLLAAILKRTELEAKK